jgi:hypothetical protein
VRNRSSVQMRRMRKTIFVETPFEKSFTFDTQETRVYLNIVQINTRVSRENADCYFVFGKMRSLELCSDLLYSTIVLSGKCIEYIIASCFTDDATVLYCPKYCGRRYKSKCALRSHLKYECGVNPRLKCEECGKLFLRTHHLKSHVIFVHKKIVPWKDKCSYTLNIIFSIPRVTSGRYSIIVELAILTNTDQKDATNWKCSRIPIVGLSLRVRRWSRSKYWILPRSSIPLKMGLALNFEYCTFLCAPSRLKTAQNIFYGNTGAPFDSIDLCWVDAKHHSLQPWRPTVACETKMVHCWLLKVVFHKSFSGSQYRA